MRHLPNNDYIGLTVVLSNPSRFDKDKLISAKAGWFFDEECLAVEKVNRAQLDIRTADTRQFGILPETKTILLLGQRALHEWTNGYKDYNISEQRGCRLDAVKEYGSDVNVLCSFNPQDCMDMQDWEGRYNEQAQYEQEDNEEEEEESSGKRKGVTARSNYRFWFSRDVRKSIHLCGKEVIYERGYETSFRLYPSPDEIVNKLLETTNSEITIDIETDPDLNVLCLGIGFGVSDIWVVPFINYNYKPCYTFQWIGRIIRALVIAFRKNKIVGHNLMFDLFVLAYKYGIPWPKDVYDTMVGHQRSFVEIEKSLGHCMSHMLFMPYHKDEGIYSPRTESQQRQLWTYNGFDILGTLLLKRALIFRATQHPGLLESMEQGNRHIHSKLIQTLHGIRFDPIRRERIWKENDRLMTHYLRAIKILTGGIDVLPTSPKQCVRYFHDLLGYKVVGRTNKGSPSLGEANFYKLRLANENPVIDFALAFRRLSKESGSMKFKAWKE